MFLSNARAVTLESILVADEFEDAFPEDLPGFPPDRAVKFSYRIRT